MAAPQAKNYPLSKLDAASFATASGLAKDDTIYLICRSGNRSMKAANILKAAGFTKLFNVSGGMIEWQAERLPVNKAQ